MAMSGKNGADDDATLGSGATMTSGSSKASSKARRRAAVPKARMNSFQDQRLLELLDPIQVVMEKILLRYGYQYHGRKALPTPYEIDLDQDNLHRATSLKLAKFIALKVDNLSFTKVCLH